jgi:hypothetical protein
MTGGVLVIDWGDVPTWVGAVATVLALVAAAIAAVFAGRAYGIESRRDAVAAADRKAAVDEQLRSQASRVVIWLKDNVAPPSGPFGVMYANTSGLPVFDVNIRLRAPNLDGGVISRMLPPTDGPVELTAASERLNVHVKSDDQILRNTMMSWTAGAYEGPIKEAVVEQPGFKIVGQLSYVGADLTFTDANERRWRRSGRGPLESVSLDADPTNSFVGPI